MRFSNAYLIVSALIVLSCSGGGDTTGPPPPPSPTVPASPTNVRVTPGVCGSGQLTVSWTASRGATGYHVYRDTDSAPKTVTTTAWVDTGLALGSSHTYQVDAFNAVGNSSKTSVTATASSMCPPTVQLSANPTSVEGGNGLTSTITIQQTNSDSCIRIPEGTPVSGSFTVTPTQTTTYTVECSGAGESVTDSVVVTVTPAVTITIHLYGAGSIGSVSGIPVVLSSGSWIDSVVSDGAGLIIVPAPIVVRDQWSASLHIAVDSVSANTVWKPSLADTTTTFALSTPLGFVLSPRQWNPKGMYAGTLVDVNIGLTQMPTPTRPYMYLPNLSGGVWQSDTILMAFDRTRTTSPISSSDSIAWWNGPAPESAARLGKVYIPANLSQILPPRSGIRVFVDTAIIYSGLAGSGTIGGGPYLNWGSVSIRGNVQFSNSGLGQHEIIHTLGGGHGCNFPTVMFDCPVGGPLGGNVTHETSAGDATYIQLFESVRRIQITTGAQFGLASTLRAE